MLYTCPCGKVHETDLNGKTESQLKWYCLQCTTDLVQTQGHGKVSLLITSKKSDKA